MFDHKILTLLAAVCLIVGCSRNTSLDIESSTTNKPESFAIKDPQSTCLGRSAAVIAAKHDGKSGFLLLDRGTDALLWRTILADAAEKTIDAQYFLWKNDDAGKIMMQRLLAAAGRGVRVRVLIDDSMTEADPEYLAVFAAHPNIELRIYKPFGPKRKAPVLRWLDYVADLRVLNHRMHNKLFVVDGSFAVVGGRNIGNEYFDYLAPFVFRGRDLLGVGPVIDTTGSAFDLYWNSDWAVPIGQVVEADPSIELAKQKWKQLDEFAKEPTHYPPGFDLTSSNLTDQLARLETQLLWGDAKLLVDAVPMKNGRKQTHAQLDSTGETLGRLIDRAEQEIHIQSAYLILLEGGLKAITAANDRGVNVKLATNSMASNNHLTAFVGYAKQRKQLLATGSKLFEMRPDAKSERALFTQEQLEKQKPMFGLHAKTMVFDRKVTFVGSFNLDPRSINLNSEMGLLVESPELAQAVAASIENDIAAGNSWQVIEQEDGHLAWITTENGVVTTETETEPMTTRARRAEAELLMVVPDKSQL